MELAKNPEIVDLALYLRDFDSLVFSDFHIGYEEMLNKQGVLVPRFQLKDMVLRLDLIFKKFDHQLKKIVINGDLKHEFGTISEQEWRDSLKLLDYLGQRCEELVLVKGNHDTILGPIAEKRNLKITESFVLGDVLICHGDKLVKADKKIKTIVIGHEHPAVSLQEGGRREMFKCFLKGRWKGKELVVMPSFNPISDGSNIIKEKRFSPYLEKSLDDFEVYVVSDKVYKFGKLKDLR